MTPDQTITIGLKGGKIITADWSDFNSVIPLDHDSLLQYIIQVIDKPESSEFLFLMENDILTKWYKNNDLS
jgi:hypothetical protein